MNRSVFLGRDCVWQPRRYAVPSTQLESSPGKIGHSQVTALFVFPAGVEGRTCAGPASQRRRWTFLLFSAREADVLCLGRAKVSTRARKARCAVRGSISAPKNLTMFDESTEKPRKPSPSRQANQMPSAKAGPALLEGIFASRASFCMGLGPDDLVTGFRSHSEPFGATRGRGVGLWLWLRRSPHPVGRRGMAGHGGAWRGFGIDVATRVSQSLRGAPGEGGLANSAQRSWSLAVHRAGASFSTPPASEGGSALADCQCANQEHDVNLALIGLKSRQASVREGRRTGSCMERSSGVSVAWSQEPKEHLGKVRASFCHIQRLRVGDTHLTPCEAF